MRHLSLLVILFLGTCLIVTAAVAPSWNEEENAWFLSLTYPDERPDDFGAGVTEGDKVLLERFKPKVIISDRGLLPVDFYGFYLPNTVVRDSSRGGRIVETSPSREYLKRIERDKRYYLDYTGPLMPCEGNSCQRYEGGNRLWQGLQGECPLQDGRRDKGIPDHCTQIQLCFPLQRAAVKARLFKEVVHEIIL